MEKTNGFWIKKLLLLTVFILFLVASFYYSLRTYSIKNTLNISDGSEKSNLKEKYPYIDYPISCDGESEAEYSKRSEHTSGYYEPEIYMNSYSNKWEKEKENQQFNVLLDLSDNGWVQKYPTNESKNNLKACNLPSEALLRNFIEEVDIRPVEFDIHGRGYFFPGKGPVITLTSKYLFTERSSKSTGECFDNKKRILNLNIESIGYHGSSGKIPADLTFSVLTPQYCSAYSFLESSGDVFLVCLSEKVSPGNIKVLILGYSVANEIIPVLKEVISETYPSETFHYFNSNYMTILENSKGYYYLFSGSKTFEIKPDVDGYLRMNSVDVPIAGQRLDVLFPNSFATESYNLPYIFLAYSSVNDKVGSIFDLNKGKFFDVDYDSCVVKSPENFCNKTIDPFLTGPYKTLHYKVISPNHIQVNQTSLNMGCVTEEGQIDVYFDNERVRCDVKVSGKLLGC
jgi:hypothetical protein